MTEKPGNGNEVGSAVWVDTSGGFEEGATVVARNEEELCDVCAKESVGVAVRRIGHGGRLGSGVVACDDHMGYYETGPNEERFETVRWDGERHHLGGGVDNA